MTEEIYGDTLFLINFSMDFLSLFLVGRLMHLDMKPWRVVLGATLGGVYGVVSLLFDLGAFNLVPAVLVMLLMCAVAFPLRGRRFFTAAALQMGMGMLLGGIMTAAFSALGRYKSYIEIGGSLHTAFGDMPLWLFGVLAVISALLTWGMGKLIRRAKGERSCTLLIAFGGESRKIACLVDSGNLLSEPISGTPVVFLKEKAADFLPEDIRLALRAGMNMSGGEVMKRLRYIPMTTVSGGGMVTAVLPDSCLLLKDGKQEAKRVLLALDTADGDFGGFPALAPEELLF